MSHFDQLYNAFVGEWRPHDTLPESYIEHDGTRYWWIYDSTGREVIRWECRPFPGCATLIITTKVELRADLRGRGLGRFFRELRHRAYKRAGFQGEIATVRTDNASQNRLMETMGGVSMGEFPSDFGGSYRLWLTKLPEQVRIGIQARTHEADVTSHLLENAPPAPVPVTVPARPRRQKTFAHRNNQ